MNEQNEGEFLSPHTEAERLWRGARDAYRTAGEGTVQLSEAVDLGMRVVEILTIECLRRVRREFPASVATLLDPLPTRIDPERDFVHPSKSLRFIDALDMLSADHLPCISPSLHHGWVDHADFCRDLRASTRRATGISLEAEQVDSLMLVGAYRNRIFLLPPPVLIVANDVLRAFPALMDLVERLFAMEQIVPMTS